MVDAAQIAVLRISGGETEERDDTVAMEAPLAIQLQSKQIAVVMRTPGHDEELAVGFLVSEGVLTEAAQITSVHHCSDRDEDDTIRVLVADSVAIDFERLKRNVYAASSCGVCGKASLDAAMSCAPPLAKGAGFDATILVQGPTLLRTTQSLFDKTGGVHGAALADAQGRLLAAREDVGRHNAVDKLIGWATLNKHDLSRTFLAVSGRVSFEIVQKALAARIPAIVAVSAPTSLAVELAQRANILVAAFVRDGRMNVYAGAERLT